jgi:hypothetical protein
VGIHTGADYKQYNEHSQSTQSVKITPPSSSPSSSSVSRSTSIDKSDSYEPSVGITPEISQTEVGLATQHAQTHSSMGVFIGIHSVLTRDHWNLNYLHNLKNREGSVPRFAITLNSRGVYKRKQVSQTKRNKNMNFNIQSIEFSESKLYD